MGPKKELHSWSYFDHATIIKTVWFVQKFGHLTSRAAIRFPLFKPFVDSSAIRLNMHVFCLHKHYCSTFHCCSHEHWAESVVTWPTELHEISTCRAFCWLLCQGQFFILLNMKVFCLHKHWHLTLLLSRGALSQEVWSRLLSSILVSASSCLKSSVGNLWRIRTLRLQSTVKRTSCRCTNCHLQIMWSSSRSQFLVSLSIMFWTLCCELRMVCESPLALHSSVQFVWGVS